VKEIDSNLSDYDDAIAARTCAASSATLIPRTGFVARRQRCLRTGGASDGETLLDKARTLLNRVAQPTH
jgi:hypothetical protein